MKNIRIRKIKENDIPEIVDIWYEASLQAHCFIPADYWKKNKELMKSKYIPMSESFLATDGEMILGFVSFIDEYLAAIFVKPESQGKKIGSLLLNHAKSHCNSLKLKVFCKNIKSIGFYKTNGFSIISESIDKETGENEFVMQWHKKKFLKSLILFLLMGSLSCIGEDSMLAVTGGGIGIQGYVYSTSDSLPINGVKIKLTSFEGKNLKRELTDVTTYSDSTGRFLCITGVGYYVRGRDTVDMVQKCKAIFSANNFKDTVFNIYKGDIYDSTNIYMHPDQLPKR